MDDRRWSESQRGKPQQPEGGAGGLADAQLRVAGGRGAHDDRDLDVVGTVHPEDAGREGRGCVGRGHAGDVRQRDLDGPHGVHLRREHLGESWLELQKEWGVWSVRRVCAIAFYRNGESLQRTEGRCVACMLCRVVVVSLLVSIVGTMSVPWLGLCRSSSW